MIKRITWAQWPLELSWMKAHRRYPFHPLPLGDDETCFWNKEECPYPFLVRDVLERRLMGSKVECCLITFHSLHQLWVSAFLRRPTTLPALPPPPRSLILTLSAHPILKCPRCARHAATCFICILRNTLETSTITAFCKETSTSRLSDMPVLFCLTHTPILLTSALYFLPKDRTKITIKWITALFYLGIRVEILITR